MVELLSRTECLKKYRSDYYINQKIAMGKLFRIDKGIYSDKENVPELALIAFKYPNAVITMETAFYLYDLSDEIPDEYSVATKREAAPISDPRVKQYFVSKDILQLGKTEFDYKGFPISTYDRERMLVELIRYKSKLPYNYYKEILLNYRRILPLMNIEKIRDYAEAMPKSKKIINTLRQEVY